LNPDELAAELASKDPEQHERAARDIHSARDWDLAVRFAGALREAVRTVPSAAAMLLLARVPDEESKHLLRQAMYSDTGKQTKLALKSPAVPLGTAASVALSAAGDPEGRRELHRLAGSEDLATRRFLLEVIDDIDDPAALQLLRRYLSDERKAPGGAPYGAVPSRRIADLAADALIDRLDLAVSFARRPTGQCP
jgi:hypothetical protein